MSGRTIVGKWQYRGDPIGGILTEEVLEILEDGTYHTNIDSTRFGKPFGGIESWGLWRLDGNKLVISPRRVVMQSGGPDEDPTVKEGDMASHTYTIEWLSDDEWTPAEYREFPPMVRVKE
jgi:hypothetical protein